MAVQHMTASEWSAENPILINGQIGIETDTGKAKIGNGADGWNALPYSLSGLTALADAIALSQFHAIPSSTADNVMTWADANGDTPKDSGVPIGSILTDTMKTGNDANVVSGTAGTDGNLARWDTNGDLVDAHLSAIHIGNTITGDRQVDIESGTADDMAIGGTTPSTGAFTILSADKAWINTGSPFAPLAVNVPDRTDGETTDIASAALLAWPSSASVSHDFSNSTAILRVIGRDVSSNLQFGVADGSYGFNPWVQASLDNSTTGDDFGNKHILLQPIGGSVAVWVQRNPSYRLEVAGSFGFTPGSSVTPTNNWDVVFELTDNTTLTIKAKGSDGTVRSGTITLS